MRFISKLAMTAAAIFFALSVSAQEVKENSSDTRLMKNVVTLGVLENGMVIHEWEWNDTARQLSSKYGLSVEEGGYPSEGLIAQDVEAIYPDAVVVDADGYLVIDIPMLAEQDELIAKMVMEGGADVVFAKKFMKKARKAGKAGSVISDMRLKQDITKIGTHRNGLSMYTWAWNDLARSLGIVDAPTVGFMAQEAQVLYPQHVTKDASGYLMLNYAALNSI